jgi:hypothetical protein
MAPNVETSIAEILESRSARVRHGEYELIGQLMMCSTPRGLVDFRKAGPVIGKLKDSEEFVFIEPWPGLPDLRKSTDQFCSACLHKCDVCNGKGEKRCEASGCGGAGVTTLRNDIDYDKTMCDLCRGVGEVTEKKKCKVCKGTKLDVCGRCRGTGKYPTGIVAGHTDPKRPNCPACGGTKFKGTLVKQDLTPFIAGRLENLLVFGPIQSFVVKPVGSDGDRSRMFNVVPDQDNNLLAILLESPEAGSPAYLLGGTIVERKM